ncbi:hypothetical protein KOR34_21340 [Posidoniimonas corsicana]|uniref:Uncharacterized protein n=1 Tax=Posidoniimonas corsicana TaxID=1938618 RepID=A0A5C5VGV2_9BACT|nr:hypothetical protein [Posidoniimonas corsicana]TWT37187.1 hypothetical protein KOR34_21340 [Posidoniimonas corsicana]
MSNNKQGERLDALCHRVIVPAGFDPKNDAEIERMLEALGGDDTAERTDRILLKVLGKRRMAWEEPVAEAYECDTNDAAANEFVEMFRAPGEPLSEDLEAKLREMEQRAMEEPSEDGETGPNEERGERGGSK